MLGLNLKVGVFENLISGLNPLTSYLKILGIGAHSICKYDLNFYFGKNWPSSKEFTGMVSKNFTACEETASEVFLWITIYGIYSIYL